MFDPRYTQAKAARKLNVSRQTIVRDELEAKQRSAKFMDNMVDLGFSLYIERWFHGYVTRIEHRIKSIETIENNTILNTEEFLKSIASHVAAMPKKEQALFLKEIYDAKLAVETEKQEYIIQIIETTIAKMITICEGFIAMYPVLKTTKRYAEYLNKLEDMK